MNVDQTQNTPHSSPLTPHSSIYVAGHRGMVGSAIVRRLKALGYGNIIARTHGELDLTDQAAVRDFFQHEKIDYVVMAAAKVGGIHANSTYPAEFIHQNLAVQVNIIHQAYKAGVERLLFLGSSCIYPRECPQPMQEEHLLTGALESTNQPYAVAKIAGIKMCEAYNRQYGTQYRSVMPTNLYGPGDNYNLENSHVIPALLRKFHLAKLVRQGDLEAIQRDEKVYGPIPEDIKEFLGLSSNTSPLTPHPSRVVIWGTGAARREFLHVDDLADACVFIMNLSDAEYKKGLSSSRLTPHSSLSFYNVGAGTDQTIAELAGLVKEVVGFEGEIVFDTTRPDGTMLKLLDVSRISALGWKAGIGLREGLARVYALYLQQ